MSEPNNQSPFARLTRSSVHNYIKIVNIKIPNVIIMVAWQSFLYAEKG